MCIAIFKPKNTKLKRKHLENSAEANPDGFGVAWSDSGKLRCFRTMKAGEWIDKVMSLESYPAIIHARIKTHGKTDLENCHPFRISGGLAFIHNGMLPISTASKPDRSDTWHFNRSVLQPLIRDTRGVTAPVVELLHEYARGSKLVFLDYRGRHLIIHEKSGEWAGGAWWSNCSYKNRPAFNWKGGGYTIPSSYGAWGDEYVRQSPIVTYSGGAVPLDDIEGIEKAIEEESVKRWEKDNFHNGK